MPVTVERCNRHAPAPAGVLFVPVVGVDLGQEAGHEFGHVRVEVHLGCGDRAVVVGEVVVEVDGEAFVEVGAHGVVCAVSAAWMAGAWRLSHHGSGWVRTAGVPEANTTARPVGSSRSSAGVRMGRSCTARVMVRRPLTELHRIVSRMMPREPKWE